jgi:hypothetical protein
MKRHVLYINSITELVHNDHGHITGFAFDTTLVEMDEKLYNYFVRHAGNKPYEFNLLSVNDQMAKVRDTTPTEIANKVHMSQIKFFKFCRKYFDCTATELIARVQGEE